MTTQRAELYRTLRRENPILPALAAWQQAQRSHELDQRIRHVAFEWLDQDGPLRIAQWQEAGFDLEVSIEADGHGWDFDGVDCIGRFTTCWEPGAIEHSRFNHRILDWFVPADPGNAQQLHRRACAYAESWTYVEIQVSARRAHVPLGIAVLSGIESDSDEHYFIKVAFDLAAEAVSDANRKLNELCASHSTGA